MKRAWPWLFSFLWLMGCSLPTRFRDQSERTLFQRHRILFAKNFEPGFQVGNPPIALDGPLLHQDLIFQADGRGKMQAWRADTGALAWEVPAHAKLHAPAAAYGETLYYGDGAGRLYARKTFSGELLYSIDVGAPIEAAPVMSEGLLFLHLRNHKLTVLDAKGGKVLWSYQRSVPFTTTLQRAGRPLVQGQRLYLGFADGHLLCMQTLDGQILWDRKVARKNKFVDIDMQPLMTSKGLLVAANGEPAVLIDPDSGLLLRQLDFAPTRTPVSWQGNYLFPTRSGELVITDQDLQVQQRQLIDPLGLTSLAVWKDEVVVGSLAGKLYFLNPQDLSVRQQHDFGHYASAFFRPFGADQTRLAVLTSRYRLYVFY